ncbi:MAG: hypothetical protein A2X34_08785 [Elusimicrobia bacterium GWC2_51_8]|nr:MAG: hypothetical protein A2X33_10535 [Elusimicrobia bacterium GWA2_51_34]OGR59985.1 MAG: hypothetical protein A2X34_08785 [Elusimicrobia bacterium GWC2_51_8]OGR87101.1 MAG: hypothetical protein A2021_04620 [Elusimicrobia bacterium GWF2_52_66]HAF95190.1 hypothetical protein [Elusimicrobiota bacterium]HCE98382.1 hypothetical protein [Elusimicrobiota bacterium]
MTKETGDSREVEVKIYSIATSLTESIIFLDETGGTRILPIWIGPMEAQAIAIRLSGYPSPRPMTHDLIFSMLKTLKLKVEKVTITDIVDNTYYSSIRVTGPEGQSPIFIDARPSDSVAVAVRFGCPIYINEAVFSKTQILNKPITEDEVVKFKQELKNLKPTDIINQLLKKPPDKKTRRRGDKDGPGEDEEDEQA